jgi:hypothetical protein
VAAKPQAEEDMEDLLVILIKWIVGAINSRSEESRGGVRLPPPRMPARSPGPPIRGRKHPVRSKPVPPTAVAVARVVPKPNRPAEVEVVAARPGRTVAGSLIGAMRNRRELAAAFVLTEVLGAPASLRRGEARNV